MQIYNYPNNIHYKYTKSNKASNISFGALQTIQASRMQAPKKIEYSLRVISNKISDIFQPKIIKKITQNIAALTPKQNKTFLSQLIEIGRIYASEKVIDANTEDKILEQIAQDGTPTIFIMNHSNQTEDPQMLAILNMLLAQCYQDAGVETFPLPKIIMNEDILKTMNPTKRKAFENFGAVGIDASLVDGNKSVNARAFLPIIKDFINNKCNIFIFPEGRMAVKKGLDLHDRFQTGIASLINKILGMKKEVRVVPVAFAYGSENQKGLNAMNIGSPIIVKRNGEETTVTKGDIEKDTKSCLFNFFDKRKDISDITITSGGSAVTKTDLPEFLKTILCENLAINVSLAEERLKAPFDISEVNLR